MLRHAIDRLFRPSRKKALKLRINARGQVTIPAKIRRLAGLSPGIEVDVVFDGEAVRLVPALTGARRTGAEIIAHLRAHRGDVKLSTDEIMHLTRGDD
jgi:AbrB family looped-hinge helix DNA binding protein